MQQGQTREALNYAQIREILFPICSLEEQKEIISRIEQGFSLIENTEKITNLMLSQLDILKSSILTLAFEGKLVSQDPNDKSAKKLLKLIKVKK